MYKFQLPDVQNKEIWLALIIDTEKFLVKFDVFDQQIDLLEVSAGEHEILDILDSSVINSIKNKIFMKLKQEDKNNYIDAIAA